MTEHGRKSVGLQLVNLHQTVSEIDSKSHKTFTKITKMKLS